jgi:DNA-binding beta-propeller fold protein YncE
LVVIDGGTNAVIATIPVSRRLGEVAVDQSGNRVYVASASLPYSIAVFDGAKNQLIGFHPTATRCPYGVAFDHALQRVYVTSYIDNNLFVLDATKLP